MGSPRPSLISSTMHTFVLLSIVSLACGAPMPQEAVEAEAPAAVEEETPAALPYVHDARGDVAEEYVHVEPVVPAVAPVAPAVTYAAYPYAGVYAGHAVAYPYAIHHTGCVNNVGSIVPCA